jgi:hypothetical protein
MKRNTPLITLLVGAALGVVLLVATMLAAPSSAPLNYSAAAASSAAPAESATPAPTESSEAPAPTRTTPTRADFAGRVGGGGGSVAVSVHGDKAIAYVCNGSTVEGWMRGKVENGKLTLTGKNQTHLTASIHTGTVTGDVEAHGTDYSFSVSTVSKSSGSHRACTRPPRSCRANVKAAGSWRDGTQVGSVETGKRPGTR